MPKRQNKLKVPHDKFFLLGFGLFFVGVIGTLLALYQAEQRQIDHLFSDQTLALVEVKLNQHNLDFLQSHWSLETNLFSLLPSATDLNAEDFTPWIGNHLALSYYPQQKFLHAFDYRRKTEARKFMQHFTLPEEALAEQPSPFGTVYSPAFSSSHAFMFYKGWLLWADSQDTLLTQLQNEQKLSDFQPYAQLKKDLPRLNLAHLYLNFAGDTSAWTQQASNQALAPFARGLGRSTPQLALALSVKDQTLQGDAKLITDQAVFDPNQVTTKPSNQTIPDLAYLTPKNVLFFQNGHNLYAKYQHTKNYLNELDPQLSLVFEGLIRAQAETWFGTDFDFETEFLELIQGPYAFVLDFSQGLEIGFVTQLGQEQDPESLKTLIQKAQARFTPVTESVELPDGTTREELVAQDPANLPIIESEINGHQYYNAQATDGQVNFSYAQVGDYWVMANRANLIRKIINVKQDQTNSLAFNQDFRQSVLYDFSTAEVYGFLNGAKLNQLDLYWQEISTAPTPTWLKTFGDWRNLVFAKSVFPEAIFFKLRLFFNSSN